MSTHLGTTVDDLASQHLPLVAHLVREVRGKVPSHVDAADLHSAGLMALVQAARSFDASRGVPFGGYATVRVRGAILDELRSVDWASRSVRRRARDLDASRSALATALGRTPSTEELAASLGLTSEEVAANEHDVARAQVISLQGSEDHDLAGLLVSSIPSPEQALEDQEQLRYLRAAVVELPERQRLVVEQYFLHERPMAEIAEQLGVSESRVSQIRAEALVLLRGALARTLDAAPAEAGTGCAVRRRETYYAAVASRADLLVSAGSAGAAYDASA